MRKHYLAVAAVAIMAFAGGALAEDMMHTFEDVPEDAYYAEAIQWAYENSITTGVSATEFGVGQPMQRQDLVTMLYRYHTQMNGGEMMEGEEDEMEMEEEMVTYKVTVMNMDETSDLSPGVLVAHDGTVSYDWTGEVVGDGAPAALELLAEKGETADLAAALEAWETVSYAWETPVVPAGETVEVEVEVPADMELTNLTWMSMYVGSNDGYVVVDYMMDGEAVTYAAYDAGTEMNEDLNGGCEAGQPGEDCTEEQMGTSEDPYVAIAAHEQLEDASAVVEWMIEMMMDEGAAEEEMMEETTEEGAEA